MKNRTKNRALSLVLIALFAALIAVGAFIKIPLGAMPITLQSGFVVLAGLTLGAKRASAAVAVYVLLGLFGLPIFVSGGGFDYVLRPSFGYLLGFIFGSAVTGVIYNRFREKRFFSAALAGIAGTLSVYIIGLPYLFLILKYYLNTAVSAELIFVSYFLIFLPGDLLCALAAAAVRCAIPKSIGLN